MRPSFSRPGTRVLPGAPCVRWLCRSSVSTRSTVRVLAELLCRTLYLFTVVQRPAYSRTRARARKAACTAAGGSTKHVYDQYTAPSDHYELMVDRSRRSYSLPARQSWARTQYTTTRYPYGERPSGGHARRFRHAPALQYQALYRTRWIQRDPTDDHTSCAPHTASPRPSPKHPHGPYLHA